MIVRNIAEAEPFTTKDGSTIRELLGIPTAPVRNQSLAEATLAAGQATDRHYHRVAEEIYFITEGGGLMEVDGVQRRVAPGDAILIPPGAWHQLTADSGPDAAPCLKLLCCCAPAYTHDDTYFE